MYLFLKAYLSINIQSADLFIAIFIPLLASYTLMHSTLEAPRVGGWVGKGGGVVAATWSKLYMPGCVG